MKLRCILKSLDIWGLDEIDEGMLLNREFTDKKKSTTRNRSFSCTLNCKRVWGLKKNIWEVYVGLSLSLNIVLFNTSQITIHSYLILTTRTLQLLQRLLSNVHTENNTGVI